MMKMNGKMKSLNPVTQVEQEEDEASTPGRRGMEERDNEREGDVNRKRGGYMPEETEASDGGGEKEKKASKEGMESYADEAERKRGGRMKMKKRARGGRMDGAEEHSAKHKMGKVMAHHHPRKRGGHVPGKMAKSRPDRRARGGATADLNPETAAGKMSVPDYERQATRQDAHAMGADKMSYGSNRRPG